MSATVVPETSTEDAHAAVVGRRPWQRYVLLAIGLLAALSLPWFIYPPVAMDIAAMALFAMALDILLGYTGLLSFGHAAFWGGSAYAAGLIAINAGVPFPIAILGGAVFAMILALPIGYLSVRRSGINSAMVTLDSAQMANSVPAKGTWLTG